MKKVETDKFEIQETQPDRMWGKWINNSDIEKLFEKSEGRKAFCGTKKLKIKA